MSKPVPREAIPPSRKNLLIVNLRRNEIKTKCGTEGKLYNSLKYLDDH